MATTQPDDRTTPGLKRLTPIQVAAELGIRYLKARDLMTTGKLGPVVFEGLKMTVPLAGVLRYKQEVANAPKP